MNHIIVSSTPSYWNEIELRRNFKNEIMLIVPMHPSDTSEVLLINLSKNN